MTIKLSTKFRTIGGASVFALSAGMSVSAAAQSAPPPVASAPTPATPTAPGNVEECVFDGVGAPPTIVCAPGTDPDGIAQATNGVDITVEAGAQVQGEISVGDNANAVVNGDFVSATGRALDVGAGSTVVNNGTVTNTTSPFSGIIRTGDGSTIINNGVIFSSQSNMGAIESNSGSTIINNGLISLTGFGTIGISGTGSVSAFGSDTGVTLTNSVTGSIFNDVGIAGIFLGTDATVINDGLIQTFGAGTVGIIVGDDSTILNTGNVVSGNANAIVASTGADISNADTGLIQASGAGADAINVSGTLDLINNGNIVSADGNAVQVNGVATVRNNQSGLIQSDGDHAILLASDGSQVISTGTVIGADSAVNAGAAADIVVVNNGTMSGRLQTIRAGENLLVVNRGTLEATQRFAVATTDGLTLRNLGAIIADGIAVRAGSNSVIENRGGSIVSATNTALRLGGASTITNEAGGLISGTVAIDALFGADSQQVVNFGAIVGTDGQAVFLGDGADEFQQWDGASVDGNVRLGAGDDTFILQGTMSSITGIVAGQAGIDNAILGGTLDADNLVLFETFSLGGMSDLRVSGARSLTGDASFDGNVTFGLGVDSLAVDGNVSLANGSVITVLTPLDEALIGQTVTVFSETGTFTDNGATINIIDDDLLVDYTPIVGSLAVQVNLVNPLSASGDRNVVAISNAVQAGIMAGTLSAGNFAALNALTSSTYQTALLDALPSLSEGVGREIFETSSAASQGLDRHLASEGSGVWGQFIVRGADQDALSLSAAGYEANETIFTVGGDIALAQNARVGLLASYADIDVDDLAANSASENSQVESIKLGIYAAVDLFDRGFFNTEVAYLTGNVDTVRGGFFGTITSGFDFDGITGRASLGYDLLPDENVSITPSIGVNAAKIQFDDAQEAGGFGFLVERGDAEFVELRGGIEFGAQISEDVNGFISGTVVHDLVDNTRSFRLSSSQIRTFFAEFPLREQDRFELNAGLNVDVSENFAIGVGYQGDFNQGYSSHAGRATVRIGF